MVWILSRRHYAFETKLVILRDESMASSKPNFVCLETRLRFRGVVWRFFCNGDVMWMRFDQGCAGDLDILCVLLQ